MITALLFAAVVMLALCQVVCIGGIRAAHRDNANLRNAVAEELARLRAPGRVARLERDLQLDLAGLPSWVQAIIRTHRAMSRG